jgi:hypothetical protein
VAQRLIVFWTSNTRIPTEIRKISVDNFVRGIFSRRSEKILAEHEFPQDICEQGNGNPKKFCWK